MSERRAEIAGYLGPLACYGPAELDALDASGAYHAEEKHDGEWVSLRVRHGAIVAVTSRSGCELDSAWWADGMALGLGLIDGELHGESMADATIRLWDVPTWADEDLRSRPIEERRMLLTVLHAAMSPSARLDLHLAEQRATGFRAYYDEIMARRGEGLVLKRRGSTLATRRRDGKLGAWLKVKPRPD